MRPIIIGYHECERAVAAEIVARSARLRPGTHRYDWLGAGIYFWEDDARRALHWAQGRREIREPAVVGAVIDLTSCLNLIQSDAVALVEEAYEYLARTNLAAERAMPANRGFEEGARYLD